MTETSDQTRPTSSQTTAALSRRLATGSAWMLAMRWSIKGIGLVSTLVLARLLTPDDFGLVAKAMILVALLEALNDTGQRIALIRMEAPTREHYDTAWTIQVGLGLLAGAIIFLGAPFAEGYLGDSTAVLLAQILALRPLIIGLENIGTVDFRRHLDFRMEFRYGVITKLTSFGVTMALAVTLRNYWALIGGIVAGSVTTVIISYVAHPYRPRPCLKRTRELWSFSTWMLLNSFVYYLQERVDQVLIAGSANAATMGHYSVGAELGRLPASEIIAPMVRAIYPVYAKIASDPTAMKTIYLKVLSIVALIMIPASVGIALVASDLVSVVLGQKWAPAAPFMVFAALAAGVSTLNATVLPVLMAIGRPRQLAIQSGLRLAVTVPFLLAGQHLGGAVGVAQAMLVVDILLIPTFFRHVVGPLSLSLGNLLAPCWRPAIATAVMAAVLISLPLGSAFDAAWLRLCVTVLLGSTLFVLTCALLWVIAGRPPGAETAIMNAALRRSSLVEPSTV